MDENCDIIVLEELRPPIQPIQKQPMQKPTQQFWVNPHSKNSRTTDQLHSQLPTLRMKDIVIP